MGLVTCRDCSTELPASAAACTQCGWVKPGTTAPRGSIYHCTGCNSVLEIPPAFAGAQIFCKRCGALRGFVSPEQPRTTFHPAIAAVLSLLIPGAGQMYRGHVRNGLIWLVAIVIGYITSVFSGLFLHLLCVVSAASRD